MKNFVYNNLQLEKYKNCKKKPIHRQWTCINFALCKDIYKNEYSNVASVFVININTEITTISDRDYKKAKNKNITKSSSKEVKRIIKRLFPNINIKIYDDYYKKTDQLCGTYKFKKRIILCSLGDGEKFRPHNESHRHTFMITNPSEQILAQIMLMHKIIINESFVA